MLQMIRGKGVVINGRSIIFTRYWLSNLSHIIHLWNKDVGFTKTAPKGNMYGALGMFVAVLVTVMKMQLSENGIEGWMWILLGLGVGAAIGYWMATTVEMTVCQN